jgi:hypothetical protein
VAENSGTDCCSKFFPDYAYGKQQYQVSEQAHSYDDFVAGRIANDPEVASSETVPLNVLRRNYSVRVDKFLSWLVSKLDLRLALPLMSVRKLAYSQSSRHETSIRFKYPCIQFAIATKFWKRILSQSAILQRSLEVFEQFPASHSNHQKAIASHSARLAPPQSSCFVIS